MRRSLPIFVCVLALWCLVFVVPASAQTQGKIDCAISCNKDCGIDPVSKAKGKDVGVCCKSWGCCPTKEVDAFATACKSLIDGKTFDSDALYIPSGKGKVPFRCGRKDSEKQYVVPNAMYNVGAGSEQNYSCQVRMVGNDDSECDEGEGGGVQQVADSGAPRKFCIKKHQEKKTACQWRMELMLGADQQAVASAANPSTPGFQKLPFGSAEWLCEKSPAMVPHNNDAYKNPEKPSRHVQAQTAGGIVGEVAQNVFFQNQPFFNNAPDRGMFGGGMSASAGGLYGVAASGGAGGGDEGNTIHLQYSQSTTMQTTNGKPFNGPGGGYVGYDDQAPGGDEAKQVAQGHEYNEQDWLSSENAVFLNTPAYATYDPADYPPGKELAMAKMLKGKTQQEVIAAKQFDHLIVNESLAALPGVGGLQGLVEKLQPNSYQFTTNSKVMKFMSSLSMAKGDFGLKLMNMFGPGANGLLGLLNGGGFSSIIQQILSGAGGGGGGGGQDGGGGTPATCTPAKFGDIDKCIASLAKAPVEVKLKQYSFDGCPRSVLDCMETNIPSELSRCYSQVADDNCTPAETGTGGAGTLGASAMGTMPGGGQILGQLKGVFGNIGGFGNTQSLMQGMKTKQLSDFKKTPFLQIFDPSHIFAPISHLMKFPMDPHYSSCAADKKCKLSEKMANYDKYVPYHNNNRRASRCSGDLNKLIRTNVIEPRYDRFNSHEAQRIHYNRWCKADELDKNRCEPGHVCAPKPCHPKTPCFTKLCYGNAPAGRAPRCKKQTIVNAENPPAAQRWNHIFDGGGYEHMMDCCPPGTTEVCTKAYNCANGFCGFNWAYHPDVKKEMDDWAKANGGDLVLTAKEKLFNDICHELAAPVPMINKFVALDGRKLAGGGGGMRAAAPLGVSNAFAQGAGGGATAVYEGGLSTSYYGNSRPYIANDTTGYEVFGKRRPDLGSDAGGYVVAAFANSYPAAAAPTGMAMNQAFPEIDLGYRDGGLGLVKDTLAAAGAGGGGGGGGSFTGCYGGTGGRTGEGCGSNGTDPSSGPAEQRIQQMYNARDFGLSCMMNGDRAIKLGMSDVFAANATGAQHQRIIREQLPNAAGNKQGGGQGALLSSFNWANACRGAPDQVKSAEAYPYGGGVKAPQVKRGIKQLAKEGKNAGGAVLILASGGAKKGKLPGLPRVAVVQYAIVGGGGGGAAALGASAAGGAGGGDSTCLVVRETNSGNWPDNFGRNSGWGQSQTRYMCDKCPKEEAEAIKKVGYKRTDCVTGDGPQCCEIDEDTEWVHYGDKANRSIEANAGGEATQKLANKGK